MRQGPFERHLTLTGEIDTVSAVELKVPRVPNGQVPIRYLAPEGAEVKAGDVVVELDSTTFVLEIKDRTLQLNQAEIDLQRQLSQNGVAEADKALDVERKRAAVKRAEVDADVPEGILPKRDYLEKQLVLERARADLERAEDALASQQAAAAADVKLKRIAVEKLRRAVDDRPGGDRHLDPADHRGGHGDHQRPPGGAPQAAGSRRRVHGHDRRPGDQLQRAARARLAVRRRRRQDRPGHARPGGAGRPPRSPLHRDGARHLAGGPLARATRGPSAGCSP